MEEQEIKLIIDDLNRVGGYAQARLLLSRLPKDVQDALRSTSRTKHVIEIKTRVITLLRDRFELSFPATSGTSWDTPTIQESFISITKLNVPNVTLQKESDISDR